MLNGKYLTTQDFIFPTNIPLCFDERSLTSSLNLGSVNSSTFDVVVKLLTTIPTTPLKLTTPNPSFILKFLPLSTTIIFWY